MLAWVRSPYILPYTKAQNTITQAHVDETANMIMSCILEIRDKIAL